MLEIKLRSTVRQLLITESDHSWLPFVQRTLKHVGSLQTLNLLSLLTRRGPQESARLINDVIHEKSIDVVYVKVEFFPSMSSDILQAINKSTTKVLFAFDDSQFYEWNALAATACDLVLCADSEHVHRYEAMGIESLLFPLETDSETFRPLGIEKSTDVLISANIAKADRRQILDAIMEGIRPFRLDVKDRYQDAVSYEALNIRYNSAKVVLNLSRAGDPVRSPLHRGLTPVLPMWAAKGRIQEAAFAGTAVVSEYFPAQNEMFPGLITFRDTEAACKEILSLLKDPDALAAYSRRLHLFAIANFAAQPVAERLRAKLLQIADSRSRSGPSTYPSRTPLSARYKCMSVRSRVLRARSFQAILAEFSWNASAASALPTALGVSHGLLGQVKEFWSRFLLGRWLATRCWIERKRAGSA